MIIRVTRQDVGGAEHVEGRIYITVDTPMYVRPRVWMGPESFQALRDVVGQDGEAWCEALGRRLDERDEDDEGLEEGLSARELFDRRVAEDASFSTDAVFGEGGWREGGPPPWCCTGAPCCTRPGPPLSTSPKIHCGEHAAK